MKSQWYEAGLRWAEQWLTAEEGWDALAMIEENDASRCEELAQIEQLPTGEEVGEDGAWIEYPEDTVLRSDAYRDFSSGCWDGITARWAD